MLWIGLLVVQSTPSKIKGSRYFPLNTSVVSSKSFSFIMVKAFALMAVGAAAMSWDEYKQQFGKVYNGDEDQARQQVFEQNKQMWGEHESGAVLGATVFSDLTLEEFQQLRIRGLNAGAKADLPNLGEVEILESTATIDWTTRGAVTPVKNQGQCGSCQGKAHESKGIVRSNIILMLS